MPARGLHAASLPRCHAVTSLQIACAPFQTAWPNRGRRCPIVWGRGWVGRALGHDTLAGDASGPRLTATPSSLISPTRASRPNVSRPLAPSEELRFSGAYRTHCRVAAARRLGKIKEEAVAARRRPGNICRGACRSLRGPHAGLQGSAVSPGAICIGSCIEAFLPLGGEQKKTPLREQRGFRVKTLAMTYSRMA